MVAFDGQMWVANVPLVPSPRSRKSQSKATGGNASVVLQALHLHVLVFGGLISARVLWQWVPILQALQYSTLGPGVHPIRMQRWETELGVAAVPESQSEEKSVIEEGRAKERMTDLPASELKVVVK